MHTIAIALPMATITGSDHQKSGWSLWALSSNAQPTIREVAR